MTVADPKCKRCGGRAVWIGIAGGAEPACARDCAGRCPSCLSADVEPFVLWSYYGILPPEQTHSVKHCVPCGAVFDDAEERK